jgi:hypothetical protein
MKKDLAQERKRWGAPSATFAEDSADFASKFRYLVALSSFIRLEVSVA